MVIRARTFLTQREGSGPVSLLPLVVKSLVRLRAFGAYGVVGCPTLLLKSAANLIRICRLRIQPTSREGEGLVGRLTVLSTGVAHAWEYGREHFIRPAPL
jgi:hypothetical protein